MMNYLSSLRTASTTLSPLTLSTKPEAECPISLTAQHLINDYKIKGKHTIWNNPGYKKKEAKRRNNDELLVLAVLNDELNHCLRRNARFGCQSLNSGPIKFSGKKTCEISKTREDILNVQFEQHTRTQASEKCGHRLFRVKFSYNFYNLRKTQEGLLSGHGIDNNSYG